MIIIIIQRLVQRYKMRLFHRKYFKTVHDIA